MQLAVDGTAEANISICKALLMVWWTGLLLVDQGSPELIVYLVVLCMNTTKAAEAGAEAGAVTSEWASGSAAVGA